MSKYSQKHTKKATHKTTTMQIAGMHCPSCDILVQRKIQKLNGVTAVVVDRSTNTATISAKRKISTGEVANILRETQYSVGPGEESKPLKSKLIEIGAIVIILLPIFYLLNSLEMFTNGVTVQDNMSLAVILGLGFVASVSSCLALTGGLLIGISTKYVKEHPHLTKRQKFAPHLYFNAGRLVGYTIFGVTIGFIGSLFTLSSMLTGLITLLASVLMIIIGLQLLQIFPVLNKIQFGIPQRWTNNILKSDTSSKKASLISTATLGGLTFFLPCGFTQAMQLFVLGKGDPVFGGIAMFVFALGTLPSLLSIGAITSALKKNWLHKISIASGIIVIFLGLFLLPSALTLVSSGSIGFNTNNNDGVFSADSFQEDPLYANTTQGDTQIVEMTVKGLSYYPHQFTVQKGVPVKWVIDGSQARGCGQILTMPGEDVFVRLDSNKNTIIEFTPTKTGDLPFHCSMAMTTPNAKFIVV